MYLISKRIPYIDNTISEKVTTSGKRNATLNKFVVCSIMFVKMFLSELTQSNIALTNVVLTGMHEDNNVLCFSQFCSSWSGCYTRHCPCCRNRHYRDCVNKPSFPFIQVSCIAAFYLALFFAIIDC